MRTLPSSQVLLAPYVTEKTSNSGERENSVCFWVHPKATKNNIIKAVEEFFPEVKVESVRTLIKARENVRFGGQMGQRKKMKKAYVKLAQGHNINLAELE